MGNKYTKLDVHAKPFRDISIDILGEMKVKPHATSRGTVKNYPLLIKCMNNGAITVQLMEESKTKDVILALLRLETRWGKINMITRDAGTKIWRRRWWRTWWRIWWMKLRKHGGQNDKQHSGQHAKQYGRQNG